LAAVKGDKTLAELAKYFSVPPTQITEWKPQLLARSRRSNLVPIRSTSSRSLLLFIRESNCVCFLISCDEAHFDRVIDRVAAEEDFGSFVDRLQQVTQGRHGVVMEIVLSVPAQSHV